MRRDVRLAAAGLLGVALLTTAACSRTTLRPARSLTSPDVQSFLPPVSVVVSRGAPLGEEAALTASPHWWLTSTRATVQVRNGTSSDRDLVVTGTVQPSPCNPAVVVRLTPPSDATGTAPVTVTATAARLAAFSLPLQVPAGTSTRVRVTIDGRGCRVGADPRMLYAALVNLSVR